MAFAAETKIPFEQSIGEIVGMVKRAGAEQIGQMDFGDRFVIAFSLGGRQIRFTVPLVTQYGGPAKHGNGAPVDMQRWIDQRNRQKGRALMLVIKAKLESVESEIETVEQAFLANVVTADNRTVYERIGGDLAIEYQSGAIRPIMIGGPAPQEQANG